MEITEKQIQKLEEQLAEIEEIALMFNGIESHPTPELDLNLSECRFDKDDIERACDAAVEGAIDMSLADLDNAHSAHERLVAAAREIKFTLEDVRFEEEKKKPLALAS